MKINQPVTQVERDYPQDAILASRTDLKGIVTYANRAFVDVSGFSLDELVGKNHNIVRHPDMPPEAFADLWRTVKAGKPWTGIVKNRCKNGDHYWVKATVTPVTENGRVSEYMSVRVKPTRAEISQAEALYAQINAGKASLERKGLAKLGYALRSIPLSLKFAVAGAFFMAVGALVGLGAWSWHQGILPDGLALTAALAATLLGAGLGWMVGRSIVRPLFGAQAIADQITNGNYNNDFHIDREDEVGRLLLAMQGMQSRLAYDRHEIQEALEDNLRIREALDEVQTPVTVSDRQNHLIYMNKAAHALFDRLAGNIREERPDFKTDDLLGTSLADFFPDEHLAEMYRKNSNGLPRAG